MVPIVTPDEMRAIDAAAPVPEATLIARAGGALAWAARRLLGGTYGRRIVVLAGKGNNGADGRVAAARLARWGASVHVLAVDQAPARIRGYDLVIDAAYGTGFHGAWEPPDVGAIPVLACDLPSGVDGATGEAHGPVLAATATTTFAALKPGLVFPPGRELAGRIDIADIGLDTSRARAHVVEAIDCATWLPRRDPTAHKWRAAVWCIAGSPGMLGAAHLCTRAAQRAGAGMVRLSTPGVDHDPLMPTEAVGYALAGDGWVDDVLADARFSAYVIGPGLGRRSETIDDARRFIARADRPIVVDGDGLFALAQADGPAAVVRDRSAPTVLTPHDGEFKALNGAPVGRDRIEAARTMSARLQCVVLLKGPATVVADPGGDALVVTAGDERLASAGTGDVLSGVLAALLAQGVDAQPAAATAAWIHGRAARLGPERGFVAGDLLEHIPTVLGELEASR